MKKEKDKDPPNVSGSQTDVSLQDYFKMTAYSDNQSFEMPGMNRRFEGDRKCPLKVLIQKFTQVSKTTQITK